MNHLQSLIYGLLCWGICLVVPNGLSAQACTDYPCVIEKIKTAIDSSSYDIAFNNLESAAAYPNADLDEITSLRKLLFDRINQEKQRAIEAEGQAQVSLAQAREEKRRADVQTQIAQQEKEKAESFVRASRNVALANAVSEYDPTLALNIMAYNIKNFPNDESTKFSHQRFKAHAKKIACTRVLASADSIHYLAITKGGGICFTAGQKGIVEWDLRSAILDTIHISKDRVAGPLRINRDGSKLVYLTQEDDFAPYVLNYLDLSNLQKKKTTLKEENFEKAETEYYFNTLTYDDEDLNPFRRKGENFYQDAGQKNENPYSVNIISSYDISKGTNSILMDAEVKDDFVIIGTTSGSLYKWLPELDSLVLYPKGHQDYITSIALFSADSLTLSQFEFEEQQMKQYTKAPIDVNDDDEGTDDLLKIDEITPTDLSMPLDDIVEERISVNPIARMDPRTQKKDSVLLGDFILTGSADGVARLWRSNAFKRTIQAYLGHFESITAVAFSPRGSICITASDDYTFKIWEVKTGKLLNTFSGFHGFPITQIQFTPDGQFFTTGNEEEPARLWEIGGRPLGAFQEIRSPFYFFDNGVITLSQDGKARVFKIPEIGHCFDPIMGRKIDCSPYQLSPNALWDAGTYLGHDDLKKINKQKNKFE